MTGSPHDSELSPGPADARTGGASPSHPVGAIVLLIALVAVASRGNPISMALRDGHVDRIELVAFVLLLFAVGIIAACALAVLVHRRRAARRAEALPLRATMVRALPIAAVTLSTLALLAIARIELELSAPPGTLRVEFVPRGDPDQPFGFTDSRNPNVRASSDPAAGDPTMLVLAPEPPRSNALARRVATALGLLGLALVAVAVWRAYARRRARRSRVHPDIELTDGEHAALHEALVDTIEAMLADPEPKTAIIGAYARLLEKLDAAGLGRMEHEAPMEHLRRALGRVRIRPGPVRQLIRLFEVARFSTHRLSRDHRQQALAALHAAAGDIAATQTLAGDDARPVGAAR